MVNLVMLQQRAMFLLRQMEWQAKLGLILLCSACGLGLGLVSQWQKQQDLLAQLARPQVHVQLQQKPEQAKDVAQQFYQLLPQAAGADALSANILRTADGLGLRFERAEFSATPLAGMRLIQYQIKLPVRGSYMQIRQFLKALLNAHPTLALMELQVRRDNVLSESVQANLVLSLYLRGEVPW